MTVEDKYTLNILSKVNGNCRISFSLPLNLKFSELVLPV
jgi:hypothetical protein